MPNLNGGLDSDATVVRKYFNKLLFVGCVFVNLITPNASYALGGAESGQNCPAGQVACISMVASGTVCCAPSVQLCSTYCKDVDQGGGEGSGDGGDDGDDGDDGGGTAITPPPGQLCQVCTDSNGNCTQYSLLCCEPCRGSVVLAYCDAGYYGSEPSCQQCPAGPNGETTTSIHGRNTFITSCYIAIGTDFSDSTGSGEWVQQCNYDMSS